MGRKFSTTNYLYARNTKIRISDILVHTEGYNDLSLQIVNGQGQLSNAFWMTLTPEKSRELAKKLLHLDNAIDEVQALPPIQVSSYGDYDDNYGTHCLTVTVNGILFYFSYDTIVAFKDSDGLYVSENIWGPTTGKHINAIDTDKMSRFPREKFEEILEEKFGNSLPSVSS